MTLHLIDADVLISAHNGYYSTTRVPEFWTWLIHHAEAGRVKMPVEMLEEVKDGTGNAEKDLLYAWLQGPGVKDALLLREEVNMETVQAVLAEGYGAGLTDVELETIGRDPFMIAHGLTDRENRCVVSNEVSAPAKKRHNRKVPDICAQFELESCNLIGLIRRLDFKTAWAPAPRR